MVHHASEIVSTHGPADIESQIALLTLKKVKLAQNAYPEAACTFRQAADVRLRFRTTELT